MRISDWSSDVCSSDLRSNAQSRVFEETLLAEQIPYRVYGGVRFFERAEIKDTLAYLRLAANRADDAAFERAVNTHTRGIGERTLDEVRKRARTDGVSLWEASIRVARGNELAARASNALAGFHGLMDALDGEVYELPLKDKKIGRAHV